jgi:hypothetical protein
VNPLSKLYIVSIQVQLQSFQELHSNTSYDGSVSSNALMYMLRLAETRHE